MYKLVYKIDGIEAPAKKENPKDLRALIAELDKSRKVIEWFFYNEGGVMLDSSAEHKKEGKK